jgi:predicted ATPase
MAGGAGRGRSPAPEARGVSAIPEKLSHYKVLRKLGSGGMGDVYLAEDEVLGRHVAIKVLPGEVINDPDRLARFRREARAVSALNHANILTIHEYGEEAGQHFFVTEYVRGQTLRQFVTRNPSIDERLAVAAGVAAALSAAHEAAVVHRDIKPDNIMITDVGAVKVLDFGLAKMMRAQSLSNQTEELSSDGARLIGTVPYMAPEQIRGLPVDGQTDIFSFGVTLYEMFEGRRPFDSTTAQDTISSILMRDPPAPVESQRISPALGRLIASTLAKESSNRPTSAQVVSELDQIREALRVLPSAQTTAAREVLVVNRLPTGSVPPPSNLPPDVTPLMGREREIAAIGAMLHRSDVRMVTITGTGGSGKTRLARRVAMQMQLRFPAGVWFVALESIDSPALVPSAIGQALGVHELVGTRLTSLITARLSDGPALLVVDNFEHVTDAAAALTSLLEAAPGLKILVTSRIPLHVRAEHEFPLDPLPVPRRGAKTRNLRDTPSVALFVERAQRVRPEFELTEQNAEAIAEICRLVDGLPLAIELAAVRVKLLSPSAMLTRLRDPISFLAGGPRDLPLRQQALHRTVEWSVQLLTEAEKQLFERMAIFSGGASIDAVTQVCESDAVSDPLAIEDTLASLLDKNLLSRDAAHEPERVTMLGPVRAVAAEKLAASAERDSLASRHLSFFARLAEVMQPVLTGSGQPMGLRRLDGELNNIRSALNWALAGHGSTDGLRLASALLPFWEVRGLWQEGLDALERLLRASSDARPELRRRSFYAAGVLADVRGDFASSRAHFQSMLAVCRSIDDRWGVADALNNIAIAALRLGEIDEAARLHRESLAVWREVENKPAIALSLHNLGNIERARGQVENARVCYSEGLETFRSIDDRRGVGLSLQLLADLDREEGKLESAASLYEQALETFIRLNHHWNVANCMADYGRLMHVRRDFQQAHELLEESLLIFREIGDRRSGGRVLESLALLALDEDQRARAEKLAGAAAAVHSSLGTDTTADPRIVSLRAAGGPSWLAGSQLSFDEAVEFAQTV